MTDPLYIAVDLGAGSGRVFIGGVQDGELLLRECRRFRYPPAERDGHLRWDFAAIFENIVDGLGMASQLARETKRPVLSLGVDGWGVDYGLLNAEGRLIADPVCYRDRRTYETMSAAFEKVPRSEIFTATGIQFLPFNTLFQLIAESNDLTGVSKLLLLPDLINFFLTGNAVSEFTNATTTQMVNAKTGDWDHDLLQAFGIPLSIFSKIVPAGTAIGELDPELSARIGLSGGVKVIAPATHDTGSAVAAAPLDDKSAYISSGTWSLIGIERRTPLVNQEVEKANFTNEGGAFGRIRFLKNVMGLWILESCRKEWETLKIEIGYDRLLNEVENNSTFGPLIFPDDPRFLNPSSMLGSIEEQLLENGEQLPERPGAIVKMILDSLAFRYASILRMIESLNAIELERIFILGGGGKNRYLNQMTADASGMKVRAGLTEATVLGNILVQAVTSGRFPSIEAARRHVTENFVFEEYDPRVSVELERAQARYSKIEARYSIELL